MGEQASIDLYFRVENLRRAFDALIELSEPSLSNHVILTLAHDQTLKPPFQAEFDHASLIQPDDSFVCQVVLVCPYRDQLFPDRSVSEQPSLLRYGVTFYLLSPIELSVRLSHQFVQFSFKATNVDMADLFLHSRAVQKAFLDYFKLAWGYAGVIHNKREGIYYSLEKPFLSWAHREDIPLASSVDQLADTCFNRYFNLEMVWSDEEAQIEFFIAWVGPYYVEKTTTWETSNPAYDTDYAYKTRLALSHINEEIFDRLYSDFNWRSHAAGYWFAGVSRHSIHTQTIGIALRARPAHARGQVFALTRFNNALAIFHLKQYLDEILKIKWKPFGKEGDYSFDWALAATSGSR